MATTLIASIPTHVTCGGPDASRWAHKCFPTRAIRQRAAASDAARRSPGVRPNAA